nr:hypothetical protein [Edaphobacter aggregans]
MSNNGIGSSIHRGFQNHLIIRIAQMWPPSKMNFNRFDQTGQVPHEQLEITKPNPMNPPLLRPAENVLVLKKQRRRGEHREPSRASKLKQPVAGS